MPDISATSQVYLTELYKNTSSKAILYSLISNLIHIFLGAALLVTSHLLEYTLSTYFFALSAVFGFLSLGCDRMVLMIVRTIAAKAHFDNKNVEEDKKSLDKYSHLAQILNIVAGIFGIFGLFFFVF